MIDTSQGYQGGVFHPSLDGGRCGAIVSLNSQGITAQCQSAESTPFFIPLSECQLDMGGASGRMIFCRSADRSLTIFCEAPGFARDLERWGSDPLLGQLQRLRQSQRFQAHRFRFWVSLSLLLLGLFGVVGYYGMLAAARTMVRALPLSIDEKIGKMAMQSMGLSPRLAKTHPASQLVTRIVDRLQPHAAIPRMDFEVTVVESDEVNAFALPGGQMVVYTGLIEQAKDSEQLAGVIAHEMAHATLRHGLQSVSQSLGIVAAIQFLVGDVGGLVALGAQVAQESVLTSYSRQSETEADLEGARMLHAAKIDPRCMAEFFALLKEEHGDIPGVMSWISTHPQHAERIENISNYEKSLPRIEYVGLEENLAEAQAALGKSPPVDATER
jgi:Zn-dependent protease with chaperone function